MVSKIYNYKQEIMIGYSDSSKIRKKFAQAGINRKQEEILKLAKKYKIELNFFMEEEDLPEEGPIQATLRSNH